MPTGSDKPLESRARVGPEFRVVLEAQVWLLIPWERGWGMWLLIFCSSEVRLEF